MDSQRSDASENFTFLTECVSDEMSAPEAAIATKECWTQAEMALAPVIGPEGMGILLRKGEEVALRNIGVARAPPDSIGAFCAWVESLATSDAVTACKAFLESVERYLVSLMGVDWARRMLARRKP